MHCVSGAVNTQFCVEVFLCAIYKFSFIHSNITPFFFFFSFSFFLLFLVDRSLILDLITN